MPRRRMADKIEIELETTSRGFARAEFIDMYGEKCSIQKSSLATEDAIWLGVDDPKPRVLVQGEGWKDVPLPVDAFLSGRMHLSREHVKALMPFLVKFAVTGELT